MKKSWIIICLILAFTVPAGLSMGNDASVAKGKDLFNNPGLGGSTNQASCSKCHPDGRGLEEAGHNENLAEMINMCIERPLKGQALDIQSTEMESLQLYIKAWK